MLLILVEQEWPNRETLYTYITHTLFDSFLTSLHVLLLELMVLIFSLAMVSKGCHTNAVIIFVADTTVVRTRFVSLLPTSSPQCLVFTRGKLFAVALMLVVDMIIQQHPFSYYHSAFSIRVRYRWPIKMVSKACFPFSHELTVVLFCKGIHLFAWHSSHISV